MEKTLLLDPNSATSSPPETAADSDSKQVPAYPKPTDHHLARSVAWSAGSDWATQIFTWLSFLEVMRLLKPSDFGIAAMAGILMPYFGQLTGLGFPRAVVALRDLTEEQLSQMNTMSVLSATVLFGIGVAIAKPFAAFFRTPALAPVFIVACSGLVMSAVVAVPNAIIGKQLRFRLLSVLTMVCTLTAAIATLALAWLGFGYWALLLGNMIPGVIRTVVILRIRPFRFAWPRFHMLREPMRFGWQISVAILAMNSYQRLDNFVAGRVLGPAALGFYGNAWELANVPIEKVSSLVTVVVPAYFSAVQDQPAALRRYVRVLTEMIALAAFPATVGLSLVAREAVPLIFGAKWAGMIAPLEVLSFYCAFRAIVALLPKVLTSIGKVRYVMWNELAALFLLPISFYIGSRWGTVGIAWAWVVAYPFIVIPLYQKTFQAIGMHVGEYMRALYPSLHGIIAMVPVVLWVKHEVALAHSLLLRLVLEVAAGALAYVGTLLLLHRERMGEIIRGLKNLRKKKDPLAIEASV
jgi:PST family polysaccharide transporter